MAPVDTRDLSGRAVACEGLTRRFDELTAVDNLTLEIEQGEVFGFLGHNGAGKTTTVRLLNGIITPNSGSARVLGLDPVSEGPALRRRTGVLTETPSVEERLTARENLMFYADLYGVPRAEAPGRASRLLETFGLAERADEKAVAYSKGMKHRLALARALLHEPELLFLDEPTSGLDPVAARQVHELIGELSHERRTVFICTHNLAEAQRLCTRVAMLEHGRLVAMGTPQELARELNGHQRIVIELAPQGLAAALAVLNNMPDLSLADPDGLATGERGSTGLQLTVVTTAPDAVPDLVDALVGAGVRIYHVTAEETSLEDVYFALHEDNDALSRTTRRRGELARDLGHRSQGRDGRLAEQGRRTAADRRAGADAGIDARAGRLRPGAGIDARPVIRGDRALPGADAGGDAGNTRRPRRGPDDARYRPEVSDGLDVPHRAPDGGERHRRGQLRREKERKTLEALLYTPTTDRELLIAKMLGAWLPAVAIAWARLPALWNGGHPRCLAERWARCCSRTRCGWCWRCGSHRPSPGLGLGITVLISARASSFRRPTGSGASSSCRSSCSWWARRRARWRFEHRARGCVGTGLLDRRRGASADR